MATKDFWKKKKFWIISAALIGIGLFIYFVFFPPSKFWQGVPPPEEIPEEIKAGKIPPSTAILYPENHSWWNRDFEVELVDSALEPGLAVGERGCQYLIEDLGTGQVGGGFRKCGPVKILVPVGENKVCSSSYTRALAKGEDEAIDSSTSRQNTSLGKCLVSTLAFDRAGHQSGWKSRIFNIDLIKPVVQEVVLPSVLEMNQEYLFETEVSDNSKIVGCWFYVDGKLIDLPVGINPIPCQNEDQCVVSLNYIFEKEGEYLVRFGCADVAGNLGFGNPAVLKVTTNHPPEISFCRVVPSQGTLETEFQFRVEAADPDGDELFYSWDFGDGQSSTEQNPIHFYLSIRNYEPKVRVSDGRGGEAQCSTAWVTVIEG